MAFNLFKTQKLKIIAYDDEKRSGSGKTFTVMFNPTSFSMQHGNQLSPKQGANTPSAQQKFVYARSNSLQLDLVLDGTGVVNWGIGTTLGKGPQSVATQIKQFMELCFDMNGSTHEPKYLRIQWGKGELANFDCRLQSVDITYSLFDKNGEPLHATLKTVFIESLDPEKCVRKANKQSPDLSHSRTVKSGDTLPLLTKEIYGSSRYYLRVAQVNNIDDFRNLTPGQQIIFPPLAKQDE